MPELPEVETVRRGLVPVLEGRRIAVVEQRRPDLRFPLPERMSERLSGRLIQSLDRRAKYLLLRLDGDEILAVHLGMTGRFLIAPPATTERASQPGQFVHAAGGSSAHDHVVIHMIDGTRVTYNDARRFGYMTLLPASSLAEHPHFRDLGIEPLGPDLTASYLAERASGRRSDLKAFLLDQRIIAGLGNIYVCEALFRAGLDPRRPAGDLALRRGTPAKRAHLLVRHIRDVLEEAVRAGGSTLRDFHHTDGTLGYFQHTFATYGREGENCTTQGCGSTVRRITQGGRSTFFCPRCQR